MFPVRSARGTVFGARSQHFVMMEQPVSSVIGRVGLIPSGVCSLLILIATQLPAGAAGDVGAREAEPISLAQSIGLQPSALFDLPPNVVQNLKPSDDLWGFFPVPNLMMLQMLPGNLWFDSSVNLSNGINTNVFGTYKRFKPDWLGALSQRHTVGWDFGEGMSVFAQYSMAKSEYYRHISLNRPVNQSISFGVKQELFPRRKDKKTAMNVNVQGGETWSASHQHSFTFAPSLSFSHTVRAEETGNGVFKKGDNISGNAALKINSVNPFDGYTQSLLTGYSLTWLRQIQPLFGRDKNAPPVNVSLTGGLNSKYPWVVHKRPKPDYTNIYCSLELSHYFLSALQSYISVQPSWYANSHRIKGISGFSCAIQGGVRMEIAKTPITVPYRVSTSAASSVVSLEIPSIDPDGTPTRIRRSGYISKVINLSGGNREVHIYTNSSWVPSGAPMAVAAAWQHQPIRLVGPPQPTAFSHVTELVGIIGRRQFLMTPPRALPLSPDRLPNYAEPDKNPKNVYIWVPPLLVPIPILEATSIAFVPPADTGKPYPDNFDDIERGSHSFVVSSPVLNANPSLLGGPVLDKAGKVLGLLRTVSKPALDGTPITKFAVDGF